MERGIPEILLEGIIYKLNSDSSIAIPLASWNHYFPEMFERSTYELHQELQNLDTPLHKNKITCVYVYTGF